MSIEDEVDSISKEDSSESEMERAWPGLAHRARIEERNYWIRYICIVTMLLTLGIALYVLFRPEEKKPEVLWLESPLFTNDKEIVQTLLCHPMVKFGLMEDEKGNRVVVWKKE